MARLSTTAKNGILDALVNGTAWNPMSSGNPYVSLHAGDPGTTGANEVTGGSYVRQQVAFNAAASGQAVNTSSVLFTLMPAAVVTHIGLWTASTAGTYHLGGVLSASITVAEGNTLTLSAEQIIASVS